MCHHQVSLISRPQLYIAKAVKKLRTNVRNDALTQTHASTRPLSGHGSAVGR